MAVPAASAVSVFISHLATPSELSWEPGRFCKQERAIEGNDDCACLVVAGRLHLDDADIGPRFGFAFLQNLCLRINRVALEYRVWQANVVPPHVGKDVLRYVSDTLSGDQGERECGVNQRFVELSLR